MTTTTFSLNDDENLVIIDAIIDGYDVRLALDTGASHTVIDLTALMIAGYRKNDAIDTIEFETAKGTDDADVFNVKKFSALGFEKIDFEIASYDFLLNNVLSSIDGVLGLDFIRNNKICIDFHKNEITIQ